MWHCVVRRVVSNFLGIIVLYLLGKMVKEDSVTLKIIALYSCGTPELLTQNSVTFHKTQIFSNTAVCISNLVWLNHVMYSSPVIIKHSLWKNLISLQQKPWQFITTSILRRSILMLLIIQVKSNVPVISGQQAWDEIKSLTLALYINHHSKYPDLLFAIQTLQNYKKVTQKFPVGTHIPEGKSTITLTQSTYDKTQTTKHKRQMHNKNALLGNANPHNCMHHRTEHKRRA
jgi:hypothetical protein